jgi:GNAT superfamily N-acetyltransferase
MEICRIQHHKKDYLELLLLGDEQESMIDRYLERGDMYVLYDSGAAKAVCVVTEESEEILELKNLAVCSQCQRRGYGRRMIEFLCDQYKGKKRILQEPGTARLPCLFMKRADSRNRIESPAFLWITMIIRS